MHKKKSLRIYTTSIVVVVVLTLTRIIKSVVTGQAPVTLELRDIPGKNTHNPSINALAGGLKLTKLTYTRLEDIT